mgnify:CR=1 FL=1
MVPRRRKRKEPERPPKEEAVVSASLVGDGTASAAPVLLALADVRRAVASRDALALCAHESATELVNALFAAAADPANRTWADVLAEARVPWLAGAMLRQSRPSEATELFSVWAHRRADELVGESLEAVASIAGATAGDVLADTARQKARAAAALWAAERLDPQVYAKRRPDDGNAAGRSVEIIIRRED